MQGEEMRAERVRIIALSRTPQRSEAAARPPDERGSHGTVPLGGAVVGVYGMP